MIKSIAELKDLIIFARSQKLKSLKIGDISLEISELAHIDAMPGLDLGQSRNTSVTASSGSLLDESDAPENDEELLYHSSRP